MTTTLSRYGTIQERDMWFFYLNLIIHLQKKVVLQNKLKPVKHMFLIAKSRVKNLCGLTQGITYLPGNSLGAKCVDIKLNSLKCMGGKKIKQPTFTSRRLLKKTTFLSLTC